MIDGLTIHQLRCFDAVVSEGSFQAAAEKLRRSQPTISSSIKNLETQLQINLLDRSGYRVILTEAGRSFHERARVFLQEFAQLRDHAAQLAMGEESELRVVIDVVNNQRAHRIVEQHDHQQDAPAPAPNPPAARRGRRAGAPPGPGSHAGPEPPARRPRRRLRGGQIRIEGHSAP